MIAALLVALLLVVPGASLREGFGLARLEWGSGRFAVDATLSLAFVGAVLLPLYLLQAPVAVASWVVAASVTALVVAAVRARAACPLAQAGPVGVSRGEAAVFVAAVALLLPAALRHSGANVDDWWDLCFVRGWLADGRFGFAQMALSPDPDTGASAVHPRFLWSAWLMMQAVVCGASGEEPWRVQAGPLAAAATVLAVSAQAALARALFRSSLQPGPLAIATIAAATAWIWGSEALPLFVRGYQDKLFAAFVLAPVLVALVLEASRACAAGLAVDAVRGGGAQTADAGDAFPAAVAAAATVGARRRAVLAVAAAAFATVSVHSLVFTMAAFVAAAAVAFAQGRRDAAWWKARAGIGAALAAAASYPLGQAAVLAMRFGEQGISLAMPDNPVVRAHLALGRLVAPSTGAWIVHPGAVFGPVALVLPFALALAWRRRRDEGARALLAMTLLPCAVLFVPGIAALAGALWVPWMLYRLGWMVPVAPALAWAVVAAAAPRTARSRGVALAVSALVVVLAAVPAADRVRRGFREHPGPSPGAPVAAAAVVYDFLAGQPGRDAVLAPPNFAEFVPARSGKPVVAFSERGTLVFSIDEARAYRRLRDRAHFFFASTTATERERIAARYGVRWAILPRRLVASGSEEDWGWRFGAQALIAARACDEGGDPGCRGWWSSSAQAVEAGLGKRWTVVLETRDYFVVERVPPRSGNESVVADPPDVADAGPRWRRPFALTPASPRPSHADVLGTVAGAPGAVVHYDVPPRFVLPSVMPVWIEGPRPWEDAPAEVTIHVDLGLPCRIDAVEVLPHLARQRREVLDVRVDGRAVVQVAQDNEAIVVGLDDPQPRSSVDVEVRSSIGNPVSLADVRLLGDAASCGSQWPRHADPVLPQMKPGAGALLDLAVRHPAASRALVALARQVRSDRDAQAAVPVLAAAVARDPSLVEAWIELGFAHDEAAEKVAGEGRRSVVDAAPTDARAAFDGAVRADSNSAWARGCAAWADRRAGRTLAAIAQAVAAAGLDPEYADAWTILGYALGDLRLDGLAERALRQAESVDPERNWPVLARAELAMRNADRAAIDAARRSLAAWVRAHPFDRAARERLSALALSPGSQP